MTTQIEPRLSGEQLKQYRQQGFVVVPGLFDLADLDPCFAAIQELSARANAEDDESIGEFETDRDNEKAVLRRIYSPFSQHEAFRQLGSDPRILDRIEQLIGSDIQFHHSKLNMKSAKVGAVIEWHQDLTFFPHTNDDLVTTLVYLDDANEANGCLRVLPGRHRSFLDHTTEEGTFAGMITEDLDDQLKDVVSLAAPAGSVIFMHCMTPHSSLPNRSAQSRRTLIFEYRAADALPIFVGDHIATGEAHTCQLRGEPAPFARFGTVSPFIPRVTKTIRSIYQLQDDTKARG